MGDPHADVGALLKIAPVGTMGRAMRGPLFAPRSCAEPEMPGYSGTPLAQKLGFKEYMKVWAVDAPKGYAAWVGALPGGATIGTRAQKKPRAVHVFATQRFRLAH